MNDFHKDNDFSMAASQELFFDAIYKKAFPNMTKRVLIDPVKAKDASERAVYMDWQKKGVDSLLYLTNGRIFAIDEKVRRPKSNGDEYSDIALEFLANDRLARVGWIEKDLSIDYLAYAFVKSQKVYLFSWPMLKRAWLRFGEEWKRKHYIAKAKNKTYYTHSVCVPTAELLTAVKNAAIIQL